ncbi:MAG: hypothetical protein ACJ8CR_28460 [Roseiflexaceae bacterium]
MQLSKEEIPREIAHQQQAVQALNERRRVLDLQAVQFGLQVPPHIVTELANLTEQIQAREIEIANLKSQSAADQVPVEEIEDHAMLAEEWDKSPGRLKLAQRARLDWARVRLGIPLERAQAMEQTLRVQLAEELFDDLTLNYLPHNYSNWPQPKTTFDFDRLRKAILLDLPITVRVFHARLQKMLYLLDRQAVEIVLLDADSTCREDDAALYGRFLNEVQALSK